MANRKPPVAARHVRKGPVAVKVQLDAQTLIMLGGMEFFQFWKRRYPMARLIL